ncbi:MAG TPA: Ger(x)C family spore germination protein [Syntrophomonadaceae bacterium]|nr:Ger(x)C family spore germination protein [Syntrophomonadaceae bacterium]
MKNQRHLRMFAVVMLLILFSGFISGCWDSRELNQLGISSGASFDIDPETGDALMTYQTIIPSKVKSSTSGSSGEQTGGEISPAVMLYHTRGATWIEALGNYYTHGDRIQFYPDDKLNIFGKELAKQGLYSPIQAIVRFPETRPNSLVLIAQDKASDILAAQDGIETIQGMGIAREIKLSAEFSNYPGVTVIEFANRLMSKTTAPIAPILSIFEDTGMEGKKSKKAGISGTAVFKRDKMVGELNKQESRGLLWAINKIKKGIVLVDAPDGSGKASLSISQAKSKIQPELIDGKITITIEIEEEGNLTEYNGFQNLSDSLLKQLEERQNEKIKSDIMAAIEKSITLNADIFGFGEAVHRKYKKDWPDLEARWEEIYPSIDVVIKVKTHVNENGDITKAVIPQ